VLRIVNRISHRESFQRRIWGKAYRMVFRTGYKIANPLHSPRRNSSTASRTPEKAI
jgi:hypothetical protein